MENKLTEFLQIVSPLVVELPRKTKANKRISLNMNTYRNLNFVVNNQAKQVYLELMRPYLEGIKIATPVEITWQIFKPTNRRLDKSNVYSVVSKYLYDAISEFKCWEDDNDDYIKTETILPTKYSKNNGHAVITIQSIKE